MPQMAPTMWLMMLMNLLLIMIIMKTMIYFWNSSSSTQTINKNIKTYKMNWLW